MATLVNWYDQFSDDHHVAVVPYGLMANLTDPPRDRKKYKAVTQKIVKSLKLIETDPIILGAKPM